MYKVEILADSINPSKVRLTTFELVIPRVVLVELNTHRALSKSTSSSRAIPTKTLLDAVITDPYIPDFSRNASGMSEGGVFLSAEDQDSAARWCLELRDLVVSKIQEAEKYKIHKQDINRYLEPWMWCTVLLTATDLQNFFKLRAHKDAAPPFRKFAFSMRQALTQSNPVQLAAGEWHIPLRDLSLPVYDALKVSTSRMARASYGRQHIVKSFVDEVAQHDDLSSKGHWSPFEHCAMALSGVDRVGNLRGYLQYRKLVEVIGGEP